MTRASTLQPSLRSVVGVHSATTSLVRAHLARVAVRLACRRPVAPIALVGSRNHLVPSRSFAVCTHPPRAMSSACAPSKHPEWHTPQGASTGITVHNSLTSTQVPFVPAKGNFVGWYTCGPTVYDSAHLGHARCYVTFDIIRRIMSDYFKFNVFYVMNITDLDDKIIIRSRRNHLLKTYTAEATSSQQVAKDISEAFAASLAAQEVKVKEAEATLAASSEKHREDNQTTYDEEKAKLALIVKERAAYDAVAAAVQAASSAPASESIAKLLASGKGPLAEWLDAAKGATVTDHSIFKAHAAYYEREFLEDMRALGVRDSDALTRVTEYVQSIVEYVQGIIKNGFAYEHAGSIYFDTAAFTAKGYSYLKLSPSSLGNTQLSQSGEGALSTNASGKKSDMDFALWKASKKGEPAWDSPWGQGRPGWHIECSAMASDLLGVTFDMHSGGSDLKFPHHDNEIAQSESHAQCRQWVNYFLHAGRLNIDGLKMSKSLKNFTTIREILKYHSARVVRFLFLLTPWDASMNFSDDSLKAATTKEKEFHEFFGNTAVAIRAKSQPDQVYPQRWNESDRRVHAKLLAVREGVDKALRDNFDYPKAMHLLSELIADVNKYRLEPEYKTVILAQATRFVDSIVRMFGVVPDHEPGFLDAAAAGSDGKLASTLDAVTSFRDAIRDAVRGKKSPGELLALCDAFRDETMLALGVRLEDVAAPGGGAVRSVWKLDDPAKLLKERDEKRREELNNRASKLRNKLDKLAKDLAKLADAQQSAKAYFATLVPGTYSQVDAETGRPTHDAEGKELLKSTAKSVAKVYDTKDKAHKEYLAKIAANPNFVADMEKEQTSLRAELEDVEAKIAAQEKQQQA